jgi:phage terminase large subunit-like protein
MTLVFRENGKYIVLPYFYIPDDNIMEKEHKDKVPYLDWKKQKLINTTPGNVIDYEFVREDLKKIAKIYKVKEVAIDRWNAVQISTQLTGDGFSVIGFGQGHASMTAPTKELEKLILSANIIHNDNPILKWQISNLGIETDAAGNIKPSKRYSTGRIDGVVAAIMAIGRWLYQAEKKPSFDKIISLSW